MGQSFGSSGRIVFPFDGFNVVANVPYGFTYEVEKGKSVTGWFSSKDGDFGKSGNQVMLVLSEGYHVISTLVDGIFTASVRVHALRPSVQNIP